MDADDTLIIIAGELKRIERVVMAAAMHLENAQPLTSAALRDSWKGIKHARENTEELRNYLLDTLPKETIPS